MADEYIDMIVQLNAQGVEIPEIRYGNLFEHDISIRPPIYGGRSIRQPRIGMMM